MTSKFPRCPECGGGVKLLGGVGRTREFIRDIHLSIPDDFKVPTCTRCGEESMTPEVSEELDKLMKDIHMIEIQDNLEEATNELDVSDSKVVTVARRPQ